MPAYEEIPFSELLHHPAATTDRLKVVRGLRLRRRDAPDLALITVEQLERETLVVRFATTVLASLVQRGDREIVRAVLPDAVPWVAFLPGKAVDEMTDELIAVARAAIAFENLAPIATVLTQWRHTAEVYADPVLLETLTRDHGDADYGPVPTPKG